MKKDRQQDGTAPGKRDSPAPAEQAERLDGWGGPAMKKRQRSTDMRRYFAVDLLPGMRVDGDPPVKDLRDLIGCKVVDLVGPNAVVVRADELQVIAEKISGANGRELERIVHVSLLVRQRAPHRPRDKGRKDDVGTLLAQLDGLSNDDARKEIRKRLGINLSVEAIKTRRSRARRRNAKSSNLR